jgi:hypothetical protein
MDVSSAELFVVRAFLIASCKRFAASFARSFPSGSARPARARERSDYLLVVYQLDRGEDGFPFYLRLIPQGANANELVADVGDEEIEIAVAADQGINVPAGGAVSVTAPAQVFGQGAAPGFTFEFWNADAAKYITPTATFSAPTDNSDFSASAWYFEDVGGPAPLVTTYAFSLNKNQVLAGKTPIASVTPAAAWTGPPSTTVPTTTSAVAITAATVIGGFGRFASWIQVGKGTIAGRTLNVPLMGGSQAIAFYGVPVPDPCAALRSELSNLSPADFPTIQDFEAALRKLTQQVISCEQAYGELP